VKWIYDSGFHHPLAAYVVGIGLLFALARRLPFLYAYLVLFTVEILADATATGAFSPIPLGSPLYTVSSVVFIVLGDFRYFFLAERVTRLDTKLARPFLVALAISIIVPLVTGIMQLTMPVMENMRVLYMVYEPALGVIVLGLDRFRYQKSDAPPEIRAFVHRVSLLFATLYFGWAACDVLIFNGIEIGHVLRIVPNVLYYAAFLPFVFYAAPESLRAIPSVRASAT
jgi:hypothetical protein